MTRLMRRSATGVAVLALAGFVYAAGQANQNDPTDVNVQVGGEHGVNVNVHHGQNMAEKDLLSGKFMVRPLSKFYSENLYNDKGEKVGVVKDLAVDPKAGEIAFGIVSFDHSVGVGDKYFAVPWAAINKDIDQKDYKKIGYSMKVDKNQLQNAKGFDKDKWPDLADRNVSRELYSYWQQQPYWEGPVARANERTEARISGTPISPEPGAQQPGAAKGQEAFILKGSELVGHDLVDQMSTKLGKLDEVMADPKSGALVYAITKITESKDIDKNLRPVPFALLSVRDVSGSEKTGNEPGKMETKSKEFRVVLNTTTDKLKSGPSFSSGNWPDMTPQWGEQVYNHYGVQPIWKGGAGHEGMHEGMHEGGQGGTEQNR